MIIIPMAGLSSRFFKAGYDLPKYMLPAHGVSLFQHCLMSFEYYFKSERFIFIIRDIHNTKSFVTNECVSLGISDFTVVTLDGETQGQAESVYLGLSQIKNLKNNHLTIFNIDTIRRNFRHPVFLADVDGYLEVFKGSGDNWSYAKEQSGQPGFVAETAEKKPISDLCSDGLYMFKDFETYERAFLAMRADLVNGRTKGELYIAPMYNYLIAEGKSVRYALVSYEDITFSGTPEEYINYCTA